jgi:hypothetical protein
MKERRLGLGGLSGMDRESGQSVRKQRDVTRYAFCGQSVLAMEERGRDEGARRISEAVAASGGDRDD